MATANYWWSLPYGPSAENVFWGPQTSAVNFCEEDYVVTRYVGEFWNTVTSLVYIAYGIHGIRRFKGQNVGVFDSVNLAYWGLIGVGIFSGLYHTTLKYHTQMTDELSMHLAIGTTLHQVFTFQQPLHIQRRNNAIILGVLVPFFIYHCVADEFAVHVIIFLSMCIIVTWKTNQIIKQRIATEAERNRLIMLAHFGTFCAAFGYFLWNIDVNFCPTLTRWKRQMGMPWGILLELHGYWHMFTGIAAYTFMAIIEFLTHQHTDDTRGVGFSWPARQVLSEIVPKKLSNGSAKKSQ